MSESAKPRDTVSSVLIAMIAVAVGCLLADDSATVTKLHEQLSSLQERNRRTSPVERRFRPVNSSATHASSNNQRSMDIPEENLLSKAGVTDVDVTETLNVQRRQKDGEFILSNESPFLRKVRLYHYKKMAESELTNNSANYSQKFSQLGIDPEKSGHLQAHLAKIHQASLEAEESIAQLLDARMKYDEQVRALMGPEQYSNYRQYEESKPAREESEHINKALTSQKLALDGAGLQAIAAVVHASGAAPSGRWHGPYDDLPDVRMGADETKGWMIDEIGRLKDGYAQLQRLLPSTPLSGEQQAAVLKYFEHGISRRETALAELENPGLRQLKANNPANQTFFAPPRELE